MGNSQDALRMVHSDAEEGDSRASKRVTTPDRIEGPARTAVPRVRPQRATTAQSERSLTRARRAAPAPP